VKRSKIEFTQKTFLEKIVINSVCSDDSFSKIEAPWFRDLITYCTREDKSLTIPTRKVLANEIENLFNNRKEALKKELNSTPGAISFVIDGWTSSNQKPFLGIVARWISDDWVLKTMVIDMKLLEGPHTGKNLASAVSETLDDFGLWDKLLAITADNAGNMDTFFTELSAIASSKGLTFDPANRKIRCLAHIMNLSCQDIIQEAKRSLISTVDSSKFSFVISFNIFD